MARGRKPKEKKGYFYEKEEEAIVQYLSATSEVEKNKIFNTILYPALTKMIESLIRKYKLFVPDEEFEQNFGDTISYLLTKINHYKPVILCYEPYNGPIEGLDIVEMCDSDFKEKMKCAEESDPEYIKVYVDLENQEEEDDDVNDELPEITPKIFRKKEKKCKAYSYCGTVCKNYLMFKCTQYNKKKLRNISYEDVYDDISNDKNFSTSYEDNASFAENVIKKITTEINTIIENRTENKLTDDEVKVGTALVTLLTNWEDVLPDNGSNKMQKSSILYFLREETMMTTKELRENMKKFKNAYYLIKKAELA